MIHEWPNPGFLTLSAIVLAIPNDLKTPESALVKSGGGIKAISLGVKPVFSSVIAPMAYAMEAFRFPQWRINPALELPGIAIIKTSLVLIKVSRICPNGRPSQVALLRI